MYNNPYMYNPQANVDRINSINNEIANLEMKRTQAMMPQPITQNFQMLNSNGVMRFANNLEEVQRDFVIGDTPFFSKDMSVVWIKSGDVGLLFSNVAFVEDYLDDRYPRECHYAKTIGEFAREHPEGRYAVTTDGHITAILEGGIIIDTFNPSDRVMRCAWKIR